MPEIDPVANSGCPEGFLKPVPSVSEAEGLYDRSQITRFNRHSEPCKRAVSNAFRANYGGIKWTGKTVYAKYKKLRPNPLTDDMDWTPFRCEY